MTQIHFIIYYTETFRLGICCSMQLFYQRNAQETIACNRKATKEKYAESTIIALFFLFFVMLCLKLDLVTIDSFKYM